MDVGKRWLLLGILVSVATVASSFNVAAAQDDQNPWSMVVEVGMAGFVDPGRPLPVTVDLTARELLVGRIDVTAGGSTVRTDVEVPAGGVKQYTIEAAPPSNRTQVTVALVDPEAEETLLSEQLRVKTPRDELLVGTVGFDELPTTLRSVTPRALDRSVIAIELEPSRLEAGPGVISHLVISADAAADLSPESVEQLAKWVRQGGRLYGPTNAVERVAPAGGGAVFPGTTVEITRVGDGEIGVVADASLVTGDEWGILLRPTPALGLVRNEVDFSAPSALLSAASVGREATVPALPWLLVGILLFVILVGPVNFIVLRSIGKPELAWLSVPLLSVLFVAGFWLIGQAQLQDFTITQASVLVDEGEGTDGFIGMVVQVERAGTHELTLPDGWEATPISGPGGALPGTPVRRDDGRSGFEFALEDLGVGAGQAQWSGAEPIAIDAELSTNSDSSTVSVTNQTEWEFWSWGIVVNGLGFTGNEVLPAGEGGDMRVRSGLSRAIYEPVISEAVARRGFVGRDDFFGEQYAVVSSLALHAEYRASSLREGDVYFFGFTDTPAPAMDVSGSRGAANGTTLVVKRLELERADALALGAVRPKLLDVVGASTVEGYYEDIYVYGAEEVYFLYEVPAGAPAQGRVSPGFSQFDVAEVFDWQSGEYVAIDWGRDFAVGEFVSPGGELILRASPGGERNEFDGDSIQLSRYQITWSTS